jgi:glycerol-3-phosphate dehydrogenase (NAD(P)+)
VTAIRRLAVVGAGAWGTALALQGRRAGREVGLLARTGERVVAGLPVTALDRAGPDDLGDAVLLVVPAHAVREVATALAGRLPAGVPVVCCAKGLDAAGPGLLLDALAAVLPGRPLLTLSGPSFADEVRADKPTALDLAASPAHRDIATALAHALHTPHFRPYVSADPVGVQLGGAAKNVVAIAAGVARGLDLGDNAEAALVTRGLAEMARLGAALGAEPQTLMGLAGLGDLVLTCHGPHSRNFRFGEALGRGRDPASAEREVGLVEGKRTAALIVALARARGVDLPIAAAVDAVLERRTGLAAAIDGLLERPLAAES